jgi:hypothetical protein
MMRILFTFLLIGNLQQIGICQTKNPDTEAAAIPENYCSTIDALAAYIKQNFATDSARIRVIYVWIANHISYDVMQFARVILIFSWPYAEEWV